MSIVAYKNIFNNSGVAVTASSESAGFEKENAYDYKQYDWWKPTSTSESWIKSSFVSAVTADYFAIYGHNLGTAKFSVTPQHSDDDVIWTNASTTQNILDNNTIYTEFTTALKKYWRILLNLVVDNLILFSEDFTNAAWLTLNATITADATVAPDLTTTADLITSSTSPGYAYQSIVIPNDNETYTASIYLKETTATASTLTISLQDGTTVTATARITWATKVIDGAGTGEAIGDGWYRLQVPVTNNTSGNTQLVVFVTPEQTAAGTVYAWGAQVVIGGSQLEYLKTPSAIPAIGGLQIGETTTLETGLQAGLAIPSISPMIENKTAMSELGVNLGATIKRTGVKGSIQLNNMTPAWARSDLEPFIDHLNNGYPAVFSWDYVNYPSETLLIWKTDDIPAPTYTSPLWMSINIPFEGVE